MRRLQLSTLILAIVALALFFVSQRSVVNAQASTATAVSTSRPACQTYHLNVNSAVVRERASGTSSVIGGLTRSEIVCVVGIATANGGWYQVDLNPSGDAPILGYVSQEVIAAGPPTTNAARLCDAYSVISQTAAVRSCATTECNAIQELKLNDQICATGYVGNYVTWIQVDNGAGTTGWLDIKDLIGDTGDIACEGWIVNVADADLYSAPDVKTRSVGNLVQGTKVCQLGEQEQSADWIRINVSGKEGFVISDLISPIVQSDVEAAPTGTATEFVEPILFASENKNVRAEASTSAALVGVLARGEQVSVVAITADGWYQIQLSNGAIGWVSQASVEVRGNTTLIATPDTQTVAQVASEIPAQPSLTPTTPNLVTATPTQPQATIAANTTVIPTETVAATTANTNIAAGSTALPACSYYTVVVDSAMVRGTPSTSGTPVTTLRRDTSVCVRGVVPFLENEWFQVDLNPNGSASTVAFMFQPLLAPMTAATPTTIESGSLVSAAGTAVATADVSGTVIAAAGTATPITVNGATATSLICPPPNSQTTGANSFATADPAAIALVTNCVTVTPTPLASAQPTAFASTAILAQDVPLSALRIRDLELQSPQGAASVSIRIPDDWSVTGTNILYLNMEYFESINPDTASIADFANPITELTVRLDGTVVSTVSLTKANVGIQTLQIALPAEILNNATRRNHTLELELDARDHCRNRLDSKVFIRADQSFIHYEYQEFLPLLDLARYPRPFYNNRQFVAEQESVWIVMPPNPSSATLNSVASIATGLGRLTGSDILIRVTTQDKLTEADRQGNHLILVGKPEDHPLIASLFSNSSLQTTRAAEGSLSFRGTALGIDDGIIDLIPHPENPKRAVMVVSGQSDEALRKAGQSLGGPPSLLGIGGSLAILTETRETFYTSGTAIGSTLKFSQLGATEDVVLSGIGTQIFDVTFNIPFGTRLTNDAYVEVLYNNAQTLAIANSNFSVLMNEVPIGSVNLGVVDPNLTTTPSPVAGYKVLRIPIPSTSVQVGTSNTLSLQLDINNDFNCEPPNRSATWFTISKDSTLYLPREIQDPATYVPLVGLFPSPFNSLPNLNNVWVSLPAEPTQVEWEAGIKVLSRLGSDTFGEGFIPKLSTGAIPSGEDLSLYHFIVIGRPTTNEFLNQLNPALPQPFVQGTDSIQQRIDDVSYLLAPGFDVGILQIMRSPFQQNNVILVLTGTSPIGEEFASTALLSQRFANSELLGNIVFANLNSVTAVDTRLITDVEEYISTIPEMATEGAIVATDQPVLLVTVTAGPTASPTLTRTPVVGGPLGGLATLTIAPTVTTPIPTFEPVALDTIQPDEVTTPSWLIGLLVVTLVLVALMILYAFIRFAVRNRRSKKPGKTTSSENRSGKTEI